LSHQVVQLDWQSGAMLLADGTALRARFVIATIPVGAINDHVASSTLFVPPLPQVCELLELHLRIRLAEILMRFQPLRLLHLPPFVYRPRSMHLRTSGWAHI
jgi:hypothetical protein